MVFLPYNIFRQDTGHQDVYTPKDAFLLQVLTSLCIPSDHKTYTEGGEYICLVSQEAPSEQETTATSPGGSGTTKLMVILCFCQIDTIGTMACPPRGHTVAPN